MKQTVAGQRWLAEPAVDPGASNKKLSHPLEPLAGKHPGPLRTDDGAHKRALPLTEGRHTHTQGDTPN